MSKILIILMFFLFTSTLVTQNNDSIGIKTVNDSLTNLEVLKSKIDLLLSNKILKSSKYSITIYSIDKKSLIYEKDPELPLVPASCTKLVTAYTAYHTLGENFAVSTDLYSDIKEGFNNALQNLYLVGKGDALLRSFDLDHFVTILKQKGIQKINGRICGDATYFDKIPDRLIYSGDKDRVEDMPPISALTLDRNTVTVLANAGSMSGKNVTVQFIPNSSYFTKNVNASVVGSGRKKKIKKSRKTGLLQNSLESKYSADFLTSSDGNLETDFYYLLNDSSSYLNSLDFAEYQLYGDTKSKKIKKSSKKKSRTVKRGIKISELKTKGNSQGFSISGTMLPNSSYSYRFYIKNPVLAAAGALKTRLENAGISTQGELWDIDIKMISAKTELIGSFSRSITDLVYVMNKQSDNFIAENIFKIIGGGKAINDSCSNRAKKSMLNSLFESGIDTAGFMFNDGSGLSRRNRISSRGLVDLLIKAKEKSFSSTFDSTLSIAGIDGTLAKRFRNTPAQNNLRAKTGTHANVSSLSGYVRSSDGELIAFSMVFNGSAVGSYKQIENQIGVLLAEFRR